MIKYYPSLKQTKYLCCVCSLTEEQNTAVNGNTMSTLCILIWKASSTVRQKSGIRKVMESVSVFIGLFRMSFMPLPFAKNFILHLMNYRLIWTNGWINTIMSEHIAENTAMEKHQCKPSRKVFILLKKKC